MSGMLPAHTAAVDAAASAIDDDVDVLFDIKPPLTAYATATAAHARARSHKYRHL